MGNTVIATVLVLLSTTIPAGVGGVNTVNEVFTSSRVSELGQSEDMVLIGGEPVLSDTGVSALAAFGMSPLLH